MIIYFVGKATIKEDLCYCQPGFPEFSGLINEVVEGTQKSFIVLGYGAIEMLIIIIIISTIK